MKNSASNEILGLIFGTTEENEIPRPKLRPFSPGEISTFGPPHTTLIEWLPGPASVYGVHSSAGDVIGLDCRRVSGDVIVRS